MVRHLQQAGGQEVGAPEQVALPGDLDVTGEQDRPAVVADPQDERGVVQFAVGPPVGAAGGRGEDVDGEFADHGALACLGLVYRDATSTGGWADPFLLAVVFRHRTVPERPDGDLPEHAVDAPDVIGVRMAEDE